MPNPFFYLALGHLHYFHSFVVEDFDNYFQTLMLRQMCLTLVRRPIQRIGMAAVCCINKTHDLCSVHLFSPSI